MSIHYYPAIVEQTADGFSCYFPDLPGCVSAAATMAELAAEAEEALSLHLAGLHEDRDPIPVPTALEQVVADPDIAVYATILVRVEMPGRAVRINLSIDEGLLARVDAEASRQKLTRSGWIAEAARRVLTGAA